MNAGSGPPVGCHHHHDPLAGSLDQLRGCSSALGASFARHLQTEPCRGLPQPAACSGGQLVRTLAALAGRRAVPARFAVLCRRLARLWRRRGACAAHCDAAGAALLRSLREVLGPAYEEVEDCWAEFYGRAAEALLAGVPASDA
jgi:hypothetical protein